MKKFLISAIALLSASAAQAAVIDLSGWTALTLDFPANQPAGTWVLQPGNTSVIQTTNADPSFFLNNLNQTAFSIDGTWRVSPGTGDDDFIGFVFGYQDSSNFYTFDWKAVNQNNAGGAALEGMAIKKFTGPTGNGLNDHTVAEFWQNTVDLGNMDVLATNHSTSAGWVAGRLYDFHLDFNVIPGQFSVVVKDGATELWNTTVNDNTFIGGQFGFYNNSQGNVEYAGFTQTGGIPTPSSVPEGGRSILLLGLGLLSIGVLRKRLQNA